MTSLKVGKLHCGLDFNPLSSFALPCGTSARGIAVFTFGAQRTNDELQKEKKRRDRVSSLGLARLVELATAPARSIQTEPRGPGWRPTRRPGVSENDWREIEEVS